MPNGKNPLMLMMALAMPGAAQAIGLGDIHVDSALNERFAAEIDIVGASALELADLRAAVANRETFLRYGADRPAFLSSATFKVAQDAQGRPVLAVRSTESFTEPVVNFLVDMNWRNGELVRQYTLLLDPAGLAPGSAPAPRSVPFLAALSTALPTASVAEWPAPAPSSAQTESAAPRSFRKTTHVKVGAKATLRGIAWRVGERSESDLQRMMIAIFHANPNAFDGNINRLHLGAVLAIPQHSELSGISKADASREFHAQMAAWRSPVLAVNAPPTVAQAPAVPATPAAPAVAEILPAAVTSIPATSASGAADEALDRRVQSLEHELSDMKGLLQTKHDQVLAMQEQTEHIETPTTVPMQSDSNYMAMSIVAGLGILASALAALYVRLRRRPPPPLASLPDNAAVSVDPAVGAALALADADEATVYAQPAASQAAQSPADLAGEHASGATTQTELPAMQAAKIDESTQPLLPALTAGGAAARALMSGDPTVNLRIDPTRLDYNLVDLDMTAQHVQMPSVLNEQVVVKERRTNLADVLRVAIEREPDRHDLRMKLLELYYSAAATNRQAFLEVVQKFARERDYLKADQWDKIAFMGRQIASENPLFAEEMAAEDDIADCA